jgi:hypothetical protein
VRLGGPDDLGASRITRKRLRTDGWPGNAGSQRDRRLEHIECGHAASLPHLRVCSAP